LPQNSSMGDPSPKPSYRTGGGHRWTGSKAERPPPAVAAGHLPQRAYGGADIGSHSTRISAVVKRRQLGIGDDNRDFVQWNVQFFCDDLSQAGSGSTPDIGGANRQFHFAVSIDPDARVG